MLKTGERMEIGVVECPDPAWAGQVAPLLGHKGPEWRHHIEAALREPLDELQTLFYLGLVEGTAITTVMIAGARRAPPGAASWATSTPGRSTAGRGRTRT